MTVKEIEQALQALPHKTLCSYPTPIERLSHMELNLNAGPLYVKRDDLNGVGPGGNKVRPLEYLLGEAIANKCDTIIASGQQNSNLCAIAASACCRLGLKCILVHNNPMPKNATGNILLNQLSQVEEHYIGTMPEPERDHYVQLLAEQLTLQGRHPYVIENGATTPNGSIGYIHLVLELMHTMEQFPISDLFLSGGNGGLASGTILGAALLDKPFHVHVITVEHEKDELKQIIQKLITGMEKRLGCSVPSTAIDQVMTIHDAYRGDGWGIPTKESDEMIHYMARTEGIFLERVYNSKTFWGMYDLLQSKTIQSRGACIVHSGGFASLFSQYNSDAEPNN